MKTNDSLDPKEDPKYGFDADELIAATEEMVAIHTGEKKAPRSTQYIGSVFVTEHVHGELVWSLEIGAEQFRQEFEGQELSIPQFIKALRTSLRQTQASLAELLGVPLGTLRNWEQGKRTPDEAAIRLLKLAATNPDAFVAIYTNDPFVLA